MDEWATLASKRRALKVSKNQKLKKGGAVEGKMSRPRLDKKSRGGVAQTSSDEQLEDMHKDQDSQKTEWNEYKKGGSVKKKKYDVGGPIENTNWFGINEASKSDSDLDKDLKMYSSIDRQTDNAGHTNDMKSEGHSGAVRDMAEVLRRGMNKAASENYAKGGWIKSAIKHPGAEKRAAAKAGKSTHEFMEEHKHDSGKSGARARLGLRLSSMAKKK